MPAVDEDQAGHLIGMPVREQPDQRPAAGPSDEHVRRLKPDPVQHGLEVVGPVAERAGMSRGAIYGNFRNREELLFAVVATLWPPVTPQPLSPGASLRELLGSIGRAVAEAARERRAMAVGAASFQVYALSHPAMRQVIAEENVKVYTQIAERFTALIPEDSLPMPAETFVRVTHALSDGLMFAHFMSPEEFTDDVIVTAFQALAGPADH